MPRWHETPGKESMWKEPVLCIKESNMVGVAAMASSYREQQARVVTPNQFALSCGAGNALVIRYCRGCGELIAVRPVTWIATHRHESCRLARFQDMGDPLCCASQSTSSAFRPAWPLPRTPNI